jgi:nicotinate-nucleotide adenylyltransferase
MSADKRIAVYGGSFDPLHKGHLEIAQLALDKLSLDKIIFVPTSKNPLKANSPVATNQHRLSMLSLALENCNKFEISTIELDKGDQPSYSIDTLRQIKSKHSLEKKNFFFLIGADNLKLFHQWKDFHEIFNLCNIVVFGRDAVEPLKLAQINPNLNSDQIADLSSHFIQFDSDCSSTQIRTNLNNGKIEEARLAMEPAILNYILNNKIYLS